MEVAIVVATEVADAAVTVATAVGEAIGEVATAIGDAVASAADWVGSELGVSGAADAGATGAEAGATGAEGTAGAATGTADVSATNTLTDAVNSGVVNEGAGVQMAPAAAQAAPDAALNAPSATGQVIGGGEQFATAPEALNAPASSGVGPAADTTNIVNTNAAPGASPFDSAPPGDSYGGSPAVGDTVAANQVGSGATTGATSSNSGGILNAINQNKGLATLGGGLLSGVGSGVGAMAKGSADIRAQQIATQGQQSLADTNAQRIAGNYAGSGPGLLAPSTANTSGFPTPTQRWDPRAYGGQYQYDPGSGRVVFVPNPKTAATPSAPNPGATA